MTLSAANRIQSNSGVVTGSGFTASLPNPTMAGSTLLLFWSTNGGTVTTAPGSFDPPFFQDQAHASTWLAWRRDDQPAGETSWVLSALSSATFYWRIEEWGGLATIAQPDASGGISTSAASSLTVATDHSFTCTADVSDFAALAVFHVTGGAGAWPAGHSYGAGASAGPSSWNEVAYLVNGTGTAGSDFILAIAEAYPGASGNVGCTLTLDTTGGGVAPSTMDAWAVCYRPAMPPPAAGVLTS